MNSNTDTIHIALYHVGAKTKQIENKDIEKIFDQIFFESAQTDCAVPVVFAPKNNGTLQFSVFFRNLNAITERNFYCILCAHELIHISDDVTVFSTLDANCSYRQIEIDKLYCDLIVFTSHHDV